MFLTQFLDHCGCNVLVHGFLSFRSGLSIPVAFIAFTCKFPSVIQFSSIYPKKHLLCVDLRSVESAEQVACQCKDSAKECLFIKLFYQKVIAILHDTTQSYSIACNRCPASLAALHGYLLRLCHPPPAPEYDRSF